MQRTREEREKTGNSAKDATSGTPTTNQNVGSRIPDLEKANSTNTRKPRNSSKVRLMSSKIRGPRTTPNFSRVMIPSTQAELWPLPYSTAVNGRQHAQMPNYATR